MKKVTFILLIFFVLYMSCTNEDDVLITKPIVNGLIQKGPFLNGTSIDIYELDNNLSQTGKVYSSQILDNLGSFQLSNISLISNYVQLKANGYYFNEITNENSSSPVILYAVADVGDKTTVNVNILSHLQKSRVEYLISAGNTYAEANNQAKTEILNLFSITKPNISDFEILDISKTGEDNAILLAVSLIVQGYRTESELSDLLANISTDIREDGILNSETLGSQLINDARLLDLSVCRNNINERYKNLGLSITLPDFEKYVNQFLENTEYQITNQITYPEFSYYGENILFGDKTDFNGGFSMAANPPRGTSLKVIMRGGVWYYQALPNAPVNWKISQYDFLKEEQTFTAIESGKYCDLVLTFMEEGKGKHTVEIYENNATVPTRTKIINIY